MGQQGDKANPRLQNSLDLFYDASGHGRWIGSVEHVLNTMGAEANTPAHLNDITASYIRDTELKHTADPSAHYAPGLELESCAACGVKCLALTTPDYLVGQRQAISREFTWVDIATLEALIATPQFLASIASVPEIYKPAYTLWKHPETQAMYHLYPEMTRTTRSPPPPISTTTSEPHRRSLRTASRHSSDVDPPGATYEALLCPACDHANDAQPKSKFSKYSLAAGFDFGRPRDIGLPALTWMERMCIALVRPHMALIQLTGANNKWSGQYGLTGHVIGFRHDAPTVLDAALSPQTVLPDLDLASRIQVTFLGSQGSWDRLRPSAWKLTTFSANAESIRLWLAALKALHPSYSDIGTKAFTTNQINQAVQDVIDNATLDDPNIASAAPPTSVTTNELQSVFVGTSGPGPPNPTVRAAAALLSKRDSTPVNDVLDSTETFYDAFPDLFLFGKGGPHNGAPSIPWSSHCLNQWDNRAAECIPFLFTAWDVWKRHQSMYGASAHIRDSPGNQRRVLNFLNSINRTNLVHALEAGDEEGAKQVCAPLDGMLKLVTAKTPWTKGALSEVYGTICAYFGFFGSPTWFITVNPSDIHSPLAFGLTKRGSPDEITVLTPDLPQLGRRADAVNRNPVAAANFFRVVIDAVTGIIIGINDEKLSVKSQPTHCERAERPGAFGVPTAFVRAAACEPAHMCICASR